MKIFMRSLLLFIALGSACGDEDDRCVEDPKPGGAECFDSCECASGTCLATTRECLGSGSKPETE